MAYSTPLIIMLAVLMIVIAALAGVEPWMLALAGLVALVMFFVERRRD